MSRTGLFVLTLVAALSALTAWWFFENFEYRSTEIDIGYRGEARTNRYLAAQRFAEAMGIGAESLRRLPAADTLPPPGDVLLVSSRRNDLSAERSATLLDWVQSGGHLILAAKSSRDEVLVTLDVTFEANDPAEIDNDELRPLEIELPDTERGLAVEISPYHRLETGNPDEYPLLIEDWFGAHVLSRTLGEGRITVLSDLLFVENASIGEHDHAEFLWRLFHLHGVPAKVWLTHSDNVPPLWKWSWQRAPQTIVLLGLLVLAWLILATRRFGPVRELPAPDRRRILEHIDASGRFLWSNEAKGKLIHGVHQGLEQRSRTAHPVWSTYSAQQREELLATLTGLPEPDVRRVLRDPPADTPEDFTRTVRMLQTIRKRL